MTDAKKDVRYNGQMTLGDLRRECERNPYVLYRLWGSQLLDLHEEIVRRDERIEELLSKIGRAQNIVDGSTQ